MKAVWECRCGHRNGEDNECGNCHESRCESDIGYLSN